MTISSCWCFRVFIVVTRLDRKVRIAVYTPRWMSQEGLGVGCVVLAVPQMCSSLTKGQDGTGVSEQQLIVGSGCTNDIVVVGADSAADSDDDEKSPPARWLHPADPPADRLPVPRARGRLPGPQGGRSPPKLVDFVLCDWLPMAQFSTCSHHAKKGTSTDAFKGIAKICHGPFVADGATSAWQAMGKSISGRAAPA